MPFWPVAAREARAAARAPRTYAWRAAVTAIGIAIVPITLWLSRSAPSQGRAVFIAVGAMAFIYCLFGGVLRTADAIAEEKRENTLGLLFLTDLKVGDVISGKLLASTATLFFGLLALMPLLTIPVLLGGVTSNELMQMALCLLNSLFFSISLGFLISTLFRQGWVTICVGLGAMLGLVLFVPFVAAWFPPVMQITLFAFSPATMFAAIVYHAPNQSFWQTFAMIHCLAWLNILFTAHLLPKFWQERPRSERAQVRWEFFRRLRFGDVKTRTRFRTRLLNRNPLFWLSGREQVSSLGLMAFLMFLVAVSLAGGWQHVLYGLVALHATLLIRMSSAASHSLAEDRKSGALELLLATSLSVREVLKGRWMALGRQFFGPMLIVTLWHLFTIPWLGVMSPFSKIPLTLLAFGLCLGLSWIATGWYGMWMGLRARHPIAAIWTTFTVVVLAPWLVMAGLFSILAFFQLVPDYGEPGERKFEIAGCFVWGLYLFALNAWTARRVKRAFREAATDRFSDTQPIDWRPFWRVTWKIAAGTALLIAAVWGTRAYINYNGEREFQNALAAYPKFSLAEPPRAYVAPQQNLARWGVLALIDESSTVIRGHFPNIGALGVWSNGRRYVFPAGKASREQEEELVQLHAAARERPFIQFTAPREDMTGFSWQFYRGVHLVAARLAARAEARLQAGERPIDDVMLALRFANSLTNDPGALSSRFDMFLQIIQPVYDGILDGRWNDEDLRTIQEAFAQSDAWPHFELWRDKVVRQAVDVFATTPRAATRFGPMQLVIGNTPFWVGHIRDSSRLPGKIKSQQAEILHAGMNWMTSRNLGSYNWAPPQMKRDDLQKHVLGAMWYGLNQGAAKLGPLQTRIDQVVIACAIERFRLAEGKLPGTLDQLKPKYLSAIPNDVMTGGPLKYRLTDSGYLLYSIADGVDHGGIPERTEMIKRRQINHPGDWVWIYKK